MPRLPLALACACALATLVAPRAHAGFVDQQSLTSDTVLYGTSVGQTFASSLARPGQLPNGTIQDGNLFLSTAVAAPTAFRVDLYIGNTVAPIYQLASTIVTVFGGSNNIHFDFGKPYLIVFSGAMPQGVLVVSSLDGSSFGLLADDRNPYGLGSAVVGTSNGTAAAVPSVDLMFNEGLFVGPFAVPEPSSLTLVGLGLAGLAVCRRTRPRSKPDAPAELHAAPRHPGHEGDRARADRGRRVLRGRRGPDQTRDLHPRDLSRRGLAAGPGRRAPGRGRPDRRGRAPRLSRPAVARCSPPN